MHSSTLLEFFRFFISHSYVCGGDLVLLLHVFMKKKRKRKKKLTSVGRMQKAYSATSY